MLSVLAAVMLMLDVDVMSSSAPAETETCPWAAVRLISPAEDASDMPAPLVTCVYELPSTTASCAVIDISPVVVAKDTPEPPTTSTPLPFETRLTLPEVLPMVTPVEPDRASSPAVAASEISVAALTAISLVSEVRLTPPAAVTITSASAFESDGLLATIATGPLADATTTPRSALTVAVDCADVRLTASVVETVNCAESTVTAPEAVMAIEPSAPAELIVTGPEVLCIDMPVAPVTETAPDALTAAAPDVAVTLTPAEVDDKLIAPAATASSASSLVTLMFEPECIETGPEALLKSKPAAPEILVLPVSAVIAMLPVAFTAAPAPPAMLIAPAVEVNVTSCAAVTATSLSAPDVRVTP